MRNLCLSHFFSAIGERFWSSAQLTDIDSMYERLAIIDNYSANYVGLQHRVQQRNGFTALLKNPNDSKELALLYTLAEVAEPAHYYTRHHVKYRNELYHQQAPLNHFVDYLAVESPVLRKLNQHIEHLKQGDELSLAAIRGIVDKWHTAVPKLKIIVEQNPKLAELTPIVADFVKVTKIANNLIRQCKQGTQPASNTSQAQRTQLHQIHANSTEIVLAAAPVIGRLHQVCSNP